MPKKRRLIDPARKGLAKRPLGSVILGIAAELSLLRAREGLKLRPPKPVDHFFTPED